MRGAFLRDEHGQVVVIVALMFTVLLGFTALAIDIGRYYAERRYIQDAADAAALACARTYALGGTSATAWAAGEEILTDYNLANDPLGISITIPAYDATGLTYTYYDSIVTPINLKSGILPVTNPLGCRVALYVDVPTLFIQVAAPALETLALNARAYAIAKGGFVPVVVPKYSNGPGPGDNTETGFIHHTMQDGQDWQCTVNSDTGCTAAGNTDSTDGREFVLFGAGQKATNDNSFRGYIALDIRDFTTTDVNGDLVHDAYNGVAPDASINTLKDFEATWIREGYPGPDICAVSATEFLACAQVAVINGASAGIFVPEIEDRYKVGDTILAQLYDGTVKTIPNFTISYPNLVVAGCTDPCSTTVANQNIEFTFSYQYAQSDAQVTTTFVADNGTVTGGTGDAYNPWAYPLGSCGGTCTAATGTFATNPTPDRNGDTDYTQIWSGITLANVPKGIYTVFLQGQSGAPYPNASQLQVVTVNVADQKRQFFIDTSDTYVNTASAVSTARTATYTIRVTEGNGPNSWNGPANGITLQIDQCPKLGTTVLTCYFGATSPGTQTLTSNDGNTHTLTVEVPAGTADNQTFTGWIRGFGNDGETSSRRVNRVLQFRTATNITAGGTTEYTDIVGYAVFKITAVSSNEAKGKAITGTYLDPNDPAVAIGKDYRLVPWDYVP
jgi:Flp pilus assembly protein TadG